MTAADYAILFACASLFGTVVWCILSMANDLPPIQRGIDDEPLSDDVTDKVRKAGL